MSDDLFREIFDGEYVYVCRSLRRLGVREADVADLAQEIFVFVHRALRSYDGTRPARPWLYAFVVRLAANYRKLGRHRYECETDADQVPTAHDGESAATRDLVLRALDMLDDDKRTILVLYDLEGFEAKEIAEMSGIPANTVYSRVRLARDAFRVAVATLRRNEEAR